MLQALTLPAKKAGTSILRRQGRKEELVCVFEGVRVYVCVRVCG